MLARDIMTREVITIPRHAPVYELTKLLAEQGISGVPVCDESGKVVGMVSQADLIGLKHGSRVEDIMTPEITIVGLETPVEAVAAIMHAKGISRVLVYDKGRLVGIIARSDIVAAMAQKHRKE